MAWSGPGAGRSIGIQFLTGYLVEWSLSMDNVFVFAVIFNYLPRAAEVSVSRAVLGHHRRDRDAADVHAGRARRCCSSSNGSCRCSALFLIYTGIKLALQQRQRRRSRAQPADAAGQAAVSRRQRKITASGSSSSRMAAAASRRCSWCCW